jgi:transcriptional regulator with XRE-family HTH domain
MAQQTSSPTQRRSEIAAHIRQVRRRQGWTQQQAADFLGCSRKTYNTMERGLSELGATELDRLAEAWQVPVAFFLKKSEAERLEQSQKL